jgi:hypothetical protein
LHIVTVSFEELRHVLILLLLLLELPLRLRTTDLLLCQFAVTIPVFPRFSEEDGAGL